MPPDPAQLYDQHAAALFAFLLNVTRREADSRDVLLELFLKIVARPPKLGNKLQPDWVWSIPGK